MQEFTYGKTTWINLVAPDETTVRDIFTRFNIDPRILNELLTSSTRSHIKPMPEGYYLAIHYPRYNGKNKTVSATEIDIIRHNDLVITVSYSPNEVLHQFTREAEAATAISKNKKGNTIPPQQLIEELLVRMYREAENEVKICEDWVANIEDNVFEGFEGRMVYELSRVGRHLIHLYSILSYHGHLIQELQRITRHLEKKQEIEQPVYTAYHRAFTRLESARLVHLEVRRTNEDLLSSRRNEVMHSLTLITFLLLPLSLIAGIFGMNAVLPFTKNDHAFISILGLMVVSVLIIILFFRNRKWL